MERVFFWNGLKRIFCSGTEAEMGRTGTARKGPSLHSAQSSMSQIEKSTKNKFTKGMLNSYQSNELDHLTNAISQMINVCVEIL